MGHDKKKRIQLLEKKMAWKKKEKEEMTHQSFDDKSFIIIIKISIK
jgi:hypothetical protein